MSWPNAYVLKLLAMGVFSMARQFITRNTRGMVVKENTRNDNLDRYLTLVVGGETFGLSILKVREINEYCELTPIPMMPEFICGALNLRGQVVPVIDLSLRLGWGRTDVQKRTCVVIAEIASNEYATMEVGLMVDAVSHVFQFSPEAINPAPSFDGAINTDFIEGVGMSGGDFVILLNIDRLLTLSDL